ncbi:DUF1549 and DUF1553 domain-containing protein [Blastopirellula marina]|uniref:DUF1549 domain-containing protein n=1 Tax=Blastopirellula marina TaxID=124 RepID=A0A2S8GM69_9BACT|nr:DUF1549 and DUF1553 domain-containing protein [Blastopirellula marina]PQO45525.1 hypothetical protein C5Y93_13840 [Blastopirellula marina]
MFRKLHAPASWVFILSLCFTGLGSQSLALAEDTTDEEAAQMHAMAARIDELVLAKLQAEQVPPAPPANDGEFVRRAYLDLVGSIPTVAQTRAYLEDGSADKREKLIAQLLKSPAHPSHLATTWRALVLEPTDDPTSLQNEQGLQQWLREKFSENVRYDRLVEEFLTATQGNNGPGYFYAAQELKPELLAAETSRIFLGLQLECAQCHDHPFDRWKQDDFWGVAAFFAQLERPNNDNNLGLGRFDIVDRSSGEVTIPDTDKVVKPSFPGTDADYASFGGTRRQQLAIWMVSRDNPFMPRRAVNWAWSHMMGRGIVHPADDMSPQNAPSHPELLDELTTYFVKSGFDMRLLLQTIAITDTYARSSEAVSASEAPPELFARMAVKSLTPEQLYDALLKVGLLRGNNDGNLNDGMRNQFVTRMRTAGKDRTTFDTGMPQALALMNGPPVSTATDPNTSGILRAMSAPFLSDEQRLNVLFLAAYSREPNEQELLRYEEFLKSASPQEQSKALGDVLWVLANSAEFMLNH